MSEVIGYGLISPNSVALLGASNVNQSLKNAYIYLGAVNVQQGTLFISGQERQISTVPALTSANRIYSNGLAEVYYNT